MPRPACCRRVSRAPRVRCFAPAEHADDRPDAVTLQWDELEAVRLVDLEGLYQQAAAEQMGISRPTLGRILESARRKVADALVNGRLLRVEGGNVTMPEQRDFRCGACGNVWTVPCEEGRPTACPTCRAINIERVHEDGSTGCCGGGGQHHAHGAQHGGGQHRCCGGRLHGTETCERTSQQS